MLGLFNKREIKEDNVTYFVEATSGLQLLVGTSSGRGATMFLQQGPPPLKNVGHVKCQTEDAEPGNHT